VEWQVSGDLNLGCRTPLYLVISTPVRTRFEGERFLAMPAGAEGPYGIKPRIDRTRIFVPLHFGAEQLKGTLKIKSYQAGPLPLEWALVEVPKRIADPKTKADFVTGQERVSEPTSLGNNIVVVAGNPTVTVRDQFSTDSPTKVIWSNSGEFALQIFKSFYRLLDRRTGELLLERGGRDPNFSPSGRFLGAFANGPGFEVIDLYAGQVVTSTTALFQPLSSADLSQS
jgi:hypothetical protein